MHVEWSKCSGRRRGRSSGRRRGRSSSSSGRSAVVAVGVVVVAVVPLVVVAVAVCRSGSFRWSWFKRLSLVQFGLGEFRSVGSIRFNSVQFGSV